jgi:hypothetical protein
MCGRLREVQRFEAQAAGLQAIIVASDAVLIKNRAVGGCLPGCILGEQPRRNAHGQTEETQPGCRHENESFRYLAYHLPPAAVGSAPEHWR